MVLTILEDQEAITTARAALAQPEQEQGIIDMIANIMVYKFTNLTRAEVEAMLATNIKQTRVYQEAFEEGEARGKTEGEARGKAEMIVLSLEHRFNALPPEAIEQIGRLNLEQLNALGRELWNFAGLNDLQAWLDATAIAATSS